MHHPSINHASILLFFPSSSFHSPFIHYILIHLSTIRPSILHISLIYQYIHSSSCFFIPYIYVYPLFIHPCIHSSILLLTLHLSSNFKLFINPHPSSIYHLFTFYQSPVHPFLHPLSTHPFQSNHPFIHHLSTLLPPIL